ncbi:MAG: RDD family protein [Cyclobacteriaceae bacterium]|nr:RDD family protein [Cyclobacteriaceae bacterium]
MEKRIGFGKRLGAYLLDMVVIYVLSFIVGTLGGSAIFMAIMGTADTNNMENDAALGAVGGILAGAMAAVAGVLIISVVIYLIEGLTGVTPGKAILGLKVGNKEGKVAVAVNF